MSRFVERGGFHVRLNLGFGSNLNNVLKRLRTGKVRGRVVLKMT